jgi:DNA polymerase-2
MQPQRLFLLTSEWVDSDNGHELRFFGRSPDLGPVMVVVDNQKPLFFVDREEKLPSLDFEFERKSVNLKCFLNQSVDALYFQNYQHMRAAAERFQATGVRHFEADIRPDERFLMERFIRGGMAVLGEPEQHDGLTVFRNPKVKAAQVPFTPSLVSVDIETGVASGELYSIGVHYRDPQCEEKHVFMLSEQNRSVSDELTFFDSEQAVLEAFIAWFQKRDPDFILGWHVVGFDLMFLERKCQDFGIELDLARGGRKILLTERPGAGYFATISGRVVIDGPPVLRGNGFSFPNYKLETVAQKVVGTGKLIASDHNKVAEIERQFREDKLSLAKYNLEDCVLVTEIYDELQLIDLLVARVATSGVLFDGLSLPHAPLDQVYLPKLHRNGYVAPNALSKGAGKMNVEAMNIPLKPGIFDHVFLLDYSSLYPDLIATFKIDPLARVRADESPAETPTGQRFSQKHHILPEVMSQFGNQAASRAYEKAMQTLSSSYCRSLRANSARFYHEDLAAALSGCARWLTETASTILKQRGFEVIYGDDSCLLAYQIEAGSESYHRAGQNLVNSLSTACRKEMQRTFGVESKVSFTCEKYYKILALPRPRLASEEGLKRYLGVAVMEDGSEAIEKVGLELSGSDWTRLANDFQREFCEQFFAASTLEDWLRRFIEEMQAGSFDDQLVFEKKLKKHPSEYTKNIPASVKAARMLPNPGKHIRYVLTKRGPVPVSLPHEDMDYDVYLKKQLSPIADPFLDLRNMSTEQLTEDKQFDLFG